MFSEQYWQRKHETQLHLTIRRFIIRYPTSLATFFRPVHVSILSPSPVDYQSNCRQTILSLACLQLGFNFQGTICTPAKVYLFNALSISMVTRTDRAIVIGCGSLKTLQSRPGKFLGSAGHCIWWVYQENIITCTYIIKSDNGFIHAPIKRPSKCFILLSDENWNMKFDTKILICNCHFQKFSLILSLSVLFYSITQSLNLNVPIKKVSQFHYIKCSGPSTFLNQKIISVLFIIQKKYIDNTSCCWPVLD